MADNEIMTFDEILADKMYQSEYDKKVTQALGTAQANLLEKLGAKDLDTLTGELQTYREAQATKEKEEKERIEKEALEKPELDRLKAELEKKAQIDADLAAEKLEKSGVLTELEGLKREKVLTKHGITDDEELEIYSLRIAKLMTDEVDFATAAKEYFEKHPLVETPPPFFTGGGKDNPKKEAAYVPPKIF